ncbi:MAG: MFS transporter [Bdellovibrionota bacterium]
MSATDSTTPTENEKGHRGFLFTGFASLFLISFLDNSRGPILPLLCEKLTIPYETAGTFLTLGCMAAVLSTFLLGYALRRSSERNVALGIAAFVILPGVLAPFVTAKWTFLLLGTLMGSAVTLMGTMCNILTIKGSPNHLRGRHLSLQQVMYGLGSLLAPLVFAQLIRLHFDWSWMLVGCSVAILLLAVGYARLLPNEPAPPISQDKPKARLSRAAILIVVLFSIYVGGEVLASMWMNLLMVGKHGKTPAEAAFYGMIFFALISGTRFLCFLFVRPKWEAIVLSVSLGLGTIFGVLGQQGHSWALAAMGIIGPFFPLCLARISRDFPDDWKSMTVLVFMGIQITLAIMHQSVGTLADTLGIENAFLLSPLFLFIALILLRTSLNPKIMTPSAP